MPERVTLTLSDRAVTLLRDRRIVSAHEQGKWVSRLIETAAAVRLAEIETELETALAALRTARGQDDTDGEKQA